MNELNTVPEMKQYIKDNALKKLGMRLTMKKPEMIEAFKKLGHWKELSSEQAEAFSQNPRLATKTFGEPKPTITSVVTEEVETVGRSPQEILALTAPVPTQTSYDFLSSEGLPALKPTTLEPPQELSTTVSIEVSDSSDIDDDFKSITFEGVKYWVRQDESNEVLDEVDLDRVGEWTGSEIRWDSGYHEMRHNSLKVGDIIIQEQEPDDDTVFEVIQDGITYNVDDENKVFDDEFDEVGTYDPISKSIMLFKKEPSTATVSSASPLPVGGEARAPKLPKLPFSITGLEHSELPKLPIIEWVYEGETYYKDIEDSIYSKQGKYVGFLISDTTLMWRPTGEGSFKRIKDYNEVKDIEIEESDDFPIEFYEGVKYYRTPEDEALDMEFEAVGRWSGGEIDFISKRYAKTHRLRVGLL